MQPFDCLTDEDKKLIWMWITNYAGVEPQSMEQILASWNKNKKQLFRAFGKQLRIKIPVHQVVHSTHRASKWVELYTPYMAYNKEDLILYKSDPRNHRFINTLVIWLQDNLENIPFYCIRDILEYTKYCYIETGKTSVRKVFRSLKHSKNLEIPENTKILRAIRKVLEYYNFPYMSIFCRWRDDISIINTDKEINAELVLSIHPFDYMTMSDNKCGWTSCMSWIDEGAYSTGTIEMMNSDVTFVAYLQSSRSFDYNGFEIPNKSWRTLGFAHKDILLIGKHYPYQSATLAETVLIEMQKILKKNLHWKYQYKNQLYRDMKRSLNNDYIREDFIRKTDGHKIYIYTDIMYNDIIEDHGTEYFCYRNYVKKNLYLNLSGPATCMCCGQKIEEPTPSKKYCHQCLDKYRCYGCGLISKEHSKERVPVKVRRQHSSQKNYSIEYGCPECLYDKYVWDSVEELLVCKKWLSAQELINGRYKIPTREILERGRPH